MGMREMSILLALWVGMIMVWMRMALSYYRHCLHCQWEWKLKWKWTSQENWEQQQNMFMGMGWGGLEWMNPPTLSPSAGREMTTGQSTMMFCAGNRRRIWLISVTDLTRAWVSDKTGIPRPNSEQSEALSCAERQFSDIVTFARSWRDNG